MFQDMGYHTAQIGKWHVDTRPSLMGFDESLVTLDIFSRARFAKNEGEPFRVAGFSPDHEVEQAREFFKRDHDKPFFLYYNIISPHMPLLDVPYQYSRMYKPEEAVLRDNVWKDGKLPHNEMWFHIYMWQIHRTSGDPLTAKTPPDFDLSNLTALYDGSVTWVDDTLGLLLAGLEEQGLADNTIVLFTSDHGDLLGSHHLWNKARLYEEAVRVPMIARWPEGIPAGVENGQQVTSLVDITPTLLDLCGETPPGHVQGQSFAPVLRGEAETLERNYAVIETPYRELGVRTPTHLYGVKVNEADAAIEEQAYQFFDMREDPYQMRNLAGANAQQATAQELLDVLEDWREDTPKLQDFEYEPWV
jgi:arylsulfatase A-like enzyme